MNTFAIEWRREAIVPWCAQVLGLLFCGFLVAFGRGTASTRPAKMDVSSEFRLYKDSLFMPLWIDCANHEKIYHHPAVGVRIESVEVDGRLIKGVPDTSDRDDFDLTTKLRESSQHVYQLVMHVSRDARSYELLSVVRIRPDDFDVIKFSIPREAKRVSLRYRARFPTDEYGLETSVIASRNELDP